jgi:hypothetical protein
LDDVKAIHIKVNTSCLEENGIAKKIRFGSADIDAPVKMEGIGPVFGTNKFRNPIIIVKLILIFRVPSLKLVNMPLG